MKKKRLLGLFVAVLCLLLFFTLTACDDNDSGDVDASNKENNVETTNGDDNATGDQGGSIGGGGEESGEPLKELAYTLNNDNTYYIVTGIGTCDDTDVVIPDTHKDLPVKSIADNAFKNCTTLNSITIPPSVVNIGSSAFSGCSGLTKVDFNATSMNDLTLGVFKNAGKSDVGFVVNVGSNVTKIPANLFGGKGDGRFFMAIDDWSSNVSNINFADGSVCEKIGENAFGCSPKLTSITLPTSLTHIETRAFAGCGFTSITIPDGVASIGESAFAFCDLLEEVKFGQASQLTTIEDLAFQYCVNLVAFEIPAQVANFDLGAFEGCYRLVEICNLSSLDIESGDWDYGVWIGNVYTASSGESKISYQDDYVFYDDEINRFLIKYNGTDTVLSLPENCNGYDYKIYSHAFGYSNITSVLIPSSVIGICERAFASEYLTSISFENVCEWEIYHDRSCSFDAIAVITSDSVSIVSYLTSTYSDRYWKRI